MFRGGDFNDAFNPKGARKHASYSNKPTPLLQRQMIHSHLDAPEKPVDARTYYEYAASATPVVPTTFDTVYEPTNPNADWAGFVSRDQMQKKHISTDHSSRMSSLQREEGGIIGMSDKQDFPRRRRGQGPISENERGNIISGIDVSSQDRYKSNNQRQMQMEGTTRDQLVLAKRVGAKGSGLNSNIHNNPAAAHLIGENAENYAVPSAIASHGMSNQSQQPPTMNKDPSYSLIGYRAPPKLASSSMFSNIGSNLLTHIPASSEPEKKPEFMPSKNLITENFNPAPGYSGARSRRSIL